MHAKTARLPYRTTRYAGSPHGGYGPDAPVASGDRTDPGVRTLRPEPHEPPPGIGTDLGVIAELAARRRYGGGSDLGLPAVPEELRRASAGGTADCAGVAWERIDAEDGAGRTPWTTTLARRSSSPTSPVLPSHHRPTG
jgi:hypothetical protein